MKSYKPINLLTYVDPLNDGELNPVSSGLHTVNISSTENVEASIISKFMVFELIKVKKQIVEAIKRRIHLEVQTNLPKL